MRILVTAGNTQTPLDSVRCITNVFSGRTGTGIAAEAHARGHDVCLLTSHPELARPATRVEGEWQVRPFRTFDDLHALLANAVQTERFDAVVHCAAVSDFHVGGIFSPAAGTEFDASTGSWHAPKPCRSPQLSDAAAGKVKSDSCELWLRLLPNPKLIDRVRQPWGFTGVLVKFKLEVGASESLLRDIAERARRQSDADLIVANTLEGMHEWALLGDRTGQYEHISRSQLATCLIDSVEDLQRKQSHRDLRETPRSEPTAVHSPDLFANRHLESSDLPSSWQGFSSRF
jgi:phosphopantothenate-cysteine ligase/phosphopantothenoylcysteine decarboxylase/phosphopantothenate--cysteine ligase